MNDIGYADVGFKKIFRSVGFQYIVVSNLFFSLFLHILVSKILMLDFDYLKSHFIVGSLEYNLVVESNNCASLPFQSKILSSINQ